MGSVIYRARTFEGIEGVQYRGVQWVQGKHSTMNGWWMEIITYYMNQNRNVLKTLSMTTTQKFLCLKKSVFKTLSIIVKISIKIWCKYSILYSGNASYHYYRCFNKLEQFNFFHIFLLYHLPCTKIIISPMKKNIFPCWILQYKI